MNLRIPALKISEMQELKCMNQRIENTKRKLARGSDVCKEMLDANCRIRQEVLSIKPDQSVVSCPSRLPEVKMHGTSLAEVNISPNTVNTGWGLELDVDLT